MFEDRTAENILKEMLKDFGADVRTDEGSLAYNACAKIAQKLEETYADLEDIYSNMDINTMDLAHLIMYGQERGLAYRYATNCVVRGEFAQKMEIGDVLSCNDYEYKITELLDDSVHAYSLTCTEDGVAPNTNIGELVPVDYIDDYEEGHIVSIIEKGIDDEDTEHYRTRVKNASGNKPFAGNRAAYREAVDNIPGVGGCKPVRVVDSEENVKIYIQADDYSGASQELIEKVQNIIDPVESSGEGEGLAPIDHVVKIVSCKGETFAVSVGVTVLSGYSIEDIKGDIINAISSYINSLQKNWEYFDKTPTTVNSSAIISAVVGVEGVLDVARLEFTRFNTVPPSKSTGSFSIPFDTIPHVPLSYIAVGEV